MVIATIAGCGGSGGGGGSSSGLPGTGSGQLTLASPLQSTVNYSSGSTPPSGSAFLTPSVQKTTESTFATQREPIHTFQCSFDLQLTANSFNGDGMTFCLQNSSATAIGSGGGGLGYTGIGSSVAVKIDLHQNSGDPSADCVGVYTGGAAPTGGDDTLASGVNLHSGDPFHVVIGYDGANLAVTITDTATSSVFTKTYAVNVPAAVGGGVACVGFTGAADTANPIIITNWQFNGAA